jgi:hypothetical protein
MPVSPGWALRALAPTTASTTSGTLTINKPAAVVNDDILILCLSHKSADFAVMPSGWTLIEREVSGTVRGEMHWKRASSEGANYAITGIDNVAIGVLSAYSGGLLSGNVVLASGKAARAGGASPAGRYGGPSLNSTEPQSLLLSMWAVSTNSGSSTPQHGFYEDAGTLSPPPIDPDLKITQRRSIFTSSSGGGIRLNLHDSLKVIPGPTGAAFTASDNFTVPYVGITAVLIRETAAATSGSRYYLARNFPPQWIDGPIVGDWETGWHNAPRTYGPMPDPPLVLSQLKSEAGKLQRFSTARGGGLTSVAGESKLIGRWLTPPLQAQTIGGTFDLMNWVSARFLPSGTHPDVRYKVNIYITVGQTTQVRHVLLDDYVDSSSFANKALVATPWKALAAPQTLASGNALEGDSVMIELGVKIVSAPTPGTLSQPATNYVDINMAHGSGYRPTADGARMPLSYQDGIAGLANTDADQRAPYFDFSHTFAELAPSEGTIPTNTTSATAEVISSLPYTDKKPATYIPLPCRPLFYRFTADRAARLLVHLWGSGYSAFLTVRVVGKNHSIWNYNRRIGTSMSAARVDTLEVGDIVEIEVTTEKASGDEYVGPSSAGELSLFVGWEEPPADNDVLVACGGLIPRFRNKQLVGLHITNDTLSGLAIDISGEPVASYLNPNWPEQTGEHRLLVGYHSSHGLIEVFELEHSNFWGQEVSYFDTTWNTGTRHPASVAVSNTGLVALGSFGDGYQFIAAAGPAAYLDRAATSGSGAISITHMRDVSSNDGINGHVLTPATIRDVPVEAGGSNYLEFAPDGETLFYTSGGWYRPVGGQNVYKCNALTGATSLFATVPVGPGPNPGLKGLFPLPDGTVLVCNGAEVVRLDSAGAVAQTYTPITDAHLAQSLADVEPTSDEQAFWVWDELTSCFWKFNIATGDELDYHRTWLSTGNSTSIVVYRESGFTGAPQAPPMQRASYVFFSQSIVEKQIETRLTKTSLQLLTADTPAAPIPSELGLVEIVGNLYTPTGAMVTYGRFLIKPRGSIRVGSELMAANEVPYNVTGPLSINLAPSNGVLYDVRFDPDPDDTETPINLKSGYFTDVWNVPDVGPVNIEDL